MITLESIEFSFLHILYLYTFKFVFMSYHLIKTYKNINKDQTDLSTLGIFLHLVFFPIIPTIGFLKMQL